MGQSGLKVSELCLGTQTFGWGADEKVAHTMWSPEWELLSLCGLEGVGVVPWLPLAGGWLTGKYRRNVPPPPNSRAARRDRREDLPGQRESDLTWQVIDTSPGMLLSCLERTKTNHC